jgi:hypothetical protein
MVRTKGSGDFTENVMASGSVTAPIGTFSTSLTVSGLPVVTSVSGLIESENMFLFQTVTGIVTLIGKAPYAREITDFTVTTLVGTASGTLSIDGTDVEGLNNQIWSVSQITSTATSNNSIPVGGRVLLTLSGESFFDRLEGTLNTRRV